MTKNLQHTPAPNPARALRCSGLQLFSLFAFLPMIAVASDHVWQTGKILDARTAKASMETGATINATSTTVGPVTDTTGHVDRQSTTVTSTYLVVVGSEFAYTVADTRSQDSLIPHAGMVHSAIIQAIGNRGHGCRFIVNDEVKFFQDKSTLHVIDADGKECKTEILRQERIARTQRELGTSPTERTVTEPRSENASVSVPPGERPTLKFDQGAGMNTEDLRVQALRRAAEEGNLSAQVNLGL